MSHKVFLTGASGFVGSAILRRLVADGTPVIAAVRQGRGAVGAGTKRNVPVV